MKNATILHVAHCCISLAIKVIRSQSQSTSIYLITNENHFNNNARYYLWHNFRYDIVTTFKNVTIQLRSTYKVWVQLLQWRLSHTGQQRHEQMLPSLLLQNNAQWIKHRPSSEPWLYTKTRSVWPTLKVKITEKVCVNKHFQASWASQSMECWFYFWTYRNIHSLRHIHYIYHKEYC